MKHWKVSFTSWMNDSVLTYWPKQFIHNQQKETGLEGPDGCFYKGGTCQGTRGTSTGANLSSCLKVLSVWLCHIHFAVIEDAFVTGNTEQTALRADLLASHGQLTPLARLAVWKLWCTKQLTKKDAGKSAPNNSKHQNWTTAEFYHSSPSQKSNQTEKWVITYLSLAPWRPRRNSAALVSCWKTRAHIPVEVD